MIAAPAKMAAAPGLAARLWAASADLAGAALGHPFVRGLADGTLPRPAFQAYVAQDAFFLDGFARAYGLALARSPDRAGLREFHELIGGVLEELHLHAAYAACWDVDLAAVQPAAATSHYVDFLLATAALGTTGDTCAAMTPCMRLYAFLGHSLASSAVRTDAGAAVQNPYAEWVRTYADPGFEALAQRLEALLDRYAKDDARTHSIYRRAMELELAFFEVHAGVPAVPAAQSAKGAGNGR